MTRLLVTLRFFATGCFLITAGDFSGISVSSASEIIWLVTRSIANLRATYIFMPRREERLEIHREFYRFARFPRVVGTIDCTHVRIESPGGEQAEFYRNRKGYFSFNVQTVCDGNLKIRDIVARWPGSTHDQTILRNSRLLARFEGGEFNNTFLLGDSGYMLTDFLLTPVLNPRTDGERRYNHAHIRVRNTVERQYGVWKRRWPVLRAGIRLSTAKVEGIIVATAVLHNIAIDAKEEEPVEEYQFDSSDSSDDESGPQRDGTVRRRLIAEVFD